MCRGGGAGHQHHRVRDGDGAVPAAPAHDRRRLPRVPVGARRRAARRLRVPAPPLAAAPGRRLGSRPPRRRARLVGCSSCLQPSVCLCCRVTNGRRRGAVVSGVRRTNEVNARQTRLVPGWVTVFGRVYRPSRYVTSQLGQLSLASLRGRLIEYQLRLR